MSAAVGLVGAGREAGICVVCATPLYGRSYIKNINCFSTLKYKNNGSQLSKIQLWLQHTLQVIHHDRMQVCFQDQQL
jgi:hypothetical protein